MTNFQKIKELILKSNLSTADQTDLIIAFSHADDSKLKNILKLFLDDISWIGRISENYKAKHYAFVTGDSSVWQDILLKEENQLNELEE